jgi:cytidine deaminase
MPTTKSISFIYQEVRTTDELLPEDQELVSAAESAASNAYAPYSHFYVGAAIRLSSGKIIKGSNVENAAFPAGICAERSALSWALTNHPGDNPETLAIIALKKDGSIASDISPCGICRQVIAEEERKRGIRIRIILAGSDAINVINSASDLLPLQFCSSSFTAGLP